MMQRLSSRLNLILWLGLTFLVGTPLQAFDWGATHLVYLKGSGYEAPDKLSFSEGIATSDSAKKTDDDIVTFEHANGTKWGDTFFFVDATNASTLRSDVYMEFAPRVSSKKTLGMNYGSLVDDILVSTQYNVGKNADPVYLYGFAIDWKVPGLNFLQSNFYVRDDRKVEGTATQITLVWQAQFQAGVKFEFSGFMDYATEEGKQDTGIKVSNLLTQPALYALVTDTLHVGLEYQYWSNKFGIKKLQDNVPQLAIRMNL